MYCVKNIKDDLFWVGGSDRRLALFENAYPIPNGISYNSYLLLDEKTVLFDTVDRAITGQFFENVESVLAGRTLDYVIINHMEPDHCATLGELIRRYPDVSVVCNAKTIPIIKQFYEFDIDTRAVIVKENDTFCSGRHTFTFLMAPMVHWPEVMVTYDTTDKILFSAAPGTKPEKAKEGNPHATHDFRRVPRPGHRRGTGGRTRRPGAGSGGRSDFQT